MKDPLYVTKCYLPEKDEYFGLISSIWGNHILTNDGELYKRFQESLKSFSKTKYVIPVVNGAIALQLAIKALDLQGEIITTPFSHFASSGSIVWERCKPVYADIDPETLNICTDEIERKITKETTGILAVHVFGNPCDMELIKSIAIRHKLKIIYDAAHAFGSTYKSRPVTDFGDISMISFHATKFIHSIEGAALYTAKKSYYDEIKKLSYFGFSEDRKSFQAFGTNAKMSEFSAAMGILSLKYFEKNKKILKENYLNYKALLKSSDRISFQKLTGEINYLYVPVIFRNKSSKMKILKVLKSNNIYPREYFYPSLEGIFNEGKIECPISYNISERIFCLPNSVYVNHNQIEEICKIIIDNL